MAVIFQKTTPPGLRFIPNFVSPFIEKKVLTESLSLHQALATKVNNAVTHRAQTYLSPQHNLSTEERFKKVILEGNIQCQHFEKYGDPGHQLTYFIGNKNIPQFVKTYLIEPMARLHEVQSLNPGILDWRFTFNTYSATHSDPSSVPGFPFHTDLPSNGTITAIYSLLSEAILEIKNDQQTCSYVLTPGSLLLLSGDARWNWQHRVLPTKMIGATYPSISRLSLVFGCHKAHSDSV